MEANPRLPDLPRIFESVLRPVPPAPPPPPPTPQKTWAGLTTERLLRSIDVVRDDRGHRYPAGTDFTVRACDSAGMDLEPPLRVEDREWKTHFKTRRRKPRRKTKS